MGGGGATLLTAVNFVGVIHVNRTSVGNIIQTVTKATASLRSYIKISEFN